MEWSLRTTSGVSLVVHGPPEPTRPVAVVLHGVGSTAEFALRCLGGPLADAGYDVVAPDLRGHGGSTALADPGDHALEAHVADLSALADRLPVRLVAGISLGAEVALRWLIGAGGDPDGAVLCLPGISGPGSPAASANRATATEVERDGVEAVLGRIAADPGAAAWVVAEVQESWRRHDPASLVAALRAVAEYGLTSPADLGRVAVPVGLVGVTDDPAHPESATDRLVSALPVRAVRRLSLGDVGADRAALGRAGLAALRSATASR